MTNIPVFGVKEEVNYVPRYGAYIVIADASAEEIILVQAPNGAYFLPGGEIEGQETKEEAVHREIFEELGFEAEIGDYLGQGDEYFYSRHRDTYYYHPGYFFSAKNWRVKGEPLEAFNQIKWFPIAEAITKLKRGSHKWAVEEWLKKQKP